MPFAAHSTQNAAGQVGSVVKFSPNFKGAGRRSSAQGRDCIPPGGRGTFSQHRVSSDAKPCVPSAVSTQRGRLLLIQTKGPFWLLGAQPGCTLSCLLWFLLRRGFAFSFLKLLQQCNFLSYLLSSFFFSLHTQNGGAGFLCVYIYIFFTSCL